ncbi:LysE/ArgO family amino acid transporter [Luteolibacter sp. Populi]|uniref:LysE/ArgO family amino acid transporter n=1 Tax=Luteolibacter sp. Populi TaxID=3230487 RepID=UPI003465513C
MNTVTFFAGMTMGLSLILAIGAQNVFVLRQGLRNDHVFSVCLACAFSDAILIVVGVSSFGKIAAVLPWLEPAMRYGGAAFLVLYGAKSLRSALRSTDALADEASTERSNLARTLLACLAITWLNPHVYLDTVVLLGTVSTQFPDSQISFTAGAVSGSFLFFFSLGYGATRLQPLFAKPFTWRILEGIIALVMWAIAVKLVAGLKYL